MKKFFLLFGMIIYLSNSCFSQWEACNTGLNTAKSRTVFALCFKGQKLFAATNDGVYLSTDNGMTWSSRNNGNYLQGTWGLGINGDLMLAGGWGGVFISKDEGLNWTYKGNGITDSVVRVFQFINDKIIIASDDNSNGGRIYVSTDECDTWAIKEIGPPFTRPACLILKDNLLFASVNAAFGNYGVFLSTDYGDTWEFKGKNISSNDLVNTLVYDDTNLYLGSYGQFGGVYLSSDNGENWTLMDNGLKVENKDTKVSVIFNTGKMLLAGMYAKGIFISNDKANSWHEKNNGLSNLTIRTFAMNKDYIFTGTYGGVFRAKIDDLTDVEDYNDTKLNINITPNPISSLATISLTNSDLSNPTISIYNSLGIEIKRFKNTELSGNSTINFTTENFPSGMYYCTLSSGINKITKSFVVVK